jgi:excisionase family DNA binding protein
MEVENLFRVEELSRIWRISRSSIYRRIREGELESIKLGGTRLVSRSQAVAYLEKARAES